MNLPANFNILTADLATILAYNAAANAAADAEKARLDAAWAAFSATEKAKWGSRPDAWSTSDEDYEG